MNVLLASYNLHLWVKTMRRWHSGNPCGISLNFFRRDTLFLQSAWCIACVYHRHTHWCNSLWGLTVPFFMEVNSAILYGCEQNHSLWKWTEPFFIGGNSTILSVDQRIGHIGLLKTFILNTCKILRANYQLRYHRQNRNK